MSCSSISSEVAWAAMMPWRAAALMATTFCMTSSRYSPLAAFRWSGVIVNPGFGTSARQRENGFMRRRIVSSRGSRRNIRGGNVNDFTKLVGEGIEGWGRGTILVLVRLDALAATRPGDGHNL